MRIIFLNLCTEILAAHGWDLELAISSFTSGNSSTARPDSSATVSHADDDDIGAASSVERVDSLQSVPQSEPAPPGLAWKLIKLPVFVISGSLGLISGAVGLRKMEFPWILPDIGPSERKCSPFKIPLSSLWTLTMKALKRLKRTSVVVESSMNGFSSHH